MLMADTVMDADERRFQIGEDEMDDRRSPRQTSGSSPIGNGTVVHDPRLRLALVDSKRQRLVSESCEATALSTNAKARFGYYSED